MRLDVLKIGDPSLRIVSKEVDIDDIKSEKIQGFIDDLIETMYAENGAGIAAIQVGNPIRIFSMEVKDNPRYPYKPNIPLTIMINPLITVMTEDSFENFEGCLSVPGLRGKVKRYLEIEVEYYDRVANKQKKVFKGITAGTVQHEFDHLNGQLFIDLVEDKSSLSTWDEFVKHYQNDFAESVKKIVDKYGS